MIEVTCHTCHRQFLIQDDAKNPVKCKRCQSEVDVPAFRKRDAEAMKKWPKCPVCGKRLAPGVKFCAACGTSTVNLGAAHRAAIDADRQLAERIGWHRLMNWFYRWF